MCRAPYVAEAREEGFTPEQEDELEAYQQQHRKKANKKLAKVQQDLRVCARVYFSKPLEDIGCRPPRIVLHCRRD